MSRHMSIFGISFLAFVGLVFGSTVHAESDAVRGARQAVLENLNSIKGIEDSSLSPLEKQTQEQPLKKIALINLLKLSAFETNDVIVQLQGLSLEKQDTVFVPLQDTLIARLSDYETYFGNLEDVLIQTNDPEDVRSIAGQFEEKRASGYTTDMQKGVELLLTLQVDSALTKADDRLAKLTATAKNTKGTKDENATRARLLETASLKLIDAHVSALAAHKKLSEYLPSQTLVTPEATSTREVTAPESAPQTSVTPEATSTPKEMTIEDALQIPEQTIRDLAEATINSIKDAYKNFIPLNDSLSNRATK